MATPDRGDPSLQGGEEAARQAALAQANAGARSGASTHQPSEEELAAQALAQAQQAQQGATRESPPIIPELAIALEAMRTEFCAAFGALNTKVEAAGQAAMRAGRMAENVGGALMEAWNHALHRAGQSPLETSPRPAAVKPPSPVRFRRMNKEPRILEWTHQAGPVLGINIGPPC